jgi:glycosyltransferase involved in cell wall biosynthesis
MRVAFIGTRGVPAGYSGFETCVEQVGRRMVERGHEVVVYCRSMHYAKRLTEYSGMKLRYLPAIKQKHLETLSHTAFSAFQLPRGTAIVCMGVGNAPVVRYLELRGRKVVFNVDGADWQREKWGRFSKWYLRTCEGLAAKGRSVVLADAEAVRSYYQRTYDRDSELVRYGADAPSDLGTDVLQKFGLQPGTYLLWVGRLVPENAANDYLEGVRQAGIDAPAVVVGDASYAERYKEALHAMAPSNAVFTGYQFGSAYQQFTAHAGMFVLAATVGGTHPVLVEQLAYGNAVLARWTENNAEVAQDAAIYFHDLPELERGLAAVTTDPALVDAKREQAKERARAFSWDEVTDSYEALLVNVRSSFGRGPKR